MRSPLAAVVACSVPLFAALAFAQEPAPPAAPAGSAAPPAGTPDGAASAAPSAPSAPTSTPSAGAIPPSAAASPASGPASNVATPPPAETAPAPATAAPAPSPAAAAPAAAPALGAQPGAAVDRDSGPATDAPAKQTKRPETTLGIEADFGISSRLGAADSAYDNVESAGPLVGAGLFYAPMKLFDLGITYQRTQLGTEDASPTNTLFANTIYRSLNSVWANVRTYPWRSEDVGVFVGLMFGPTWESSHGTVTTPPASLASSVQTYRCSASGGASLALGVTAGADFDLGGGLSFLTRLTGASYHTPGEVLTDANGTICGPGLGSTATLDARIGFAYRFDLGSPSEAQTATRH